MTTKTCSKGHELTPENTHLYRGKEARCRECGRLASRKSRERAKQGLPPHWAGSRAVPTRERILNQVDRQANGCWHWTGFINPQGYGATSYHGVRGTLAHRAMYDLLVGPIPEGLTLDHLCHTRDTTCMGGNTCIHRRCVNPDHLEPVTLEENSSRGAIGRRTHCPAGHPYDADNTLVFDGRRFCRECGRIRGAAYRAKKKAQRKAVNS